MFQVVGDEGCGIVGVKKYGAGFHGLKSIHPVVVCKEMVAPVFMSVVDRYGVERDHRAEGQHDRFLRFIQRCVFQYCRKSIADEEREKEARENKPPGSARKLFKYLRDL